MQSAPSYLENSVLFTGTGTSGSWVIRGQQIGRQLDASVIHNARAPSICKFDVVVVVKRVPETLLIELRKAGRPWILDVVDFYPQPICSQWSRSEAIGWVRERLRYLKPTAVIWPNARMQKDCGFDGPSVFISHHHRPGIVANPIRETVRTIGYEGAANYLEGWMPDIQEQCQKRNWKFVVNPKNLADLDIVLALRGGQWDGYCQQHWKSNVKLANAQGSGTPFIGQPEDGYQETASGAEYWTSNARQLEQAFDWLSPLGNRKSVSEKLKEKAFTVEEASQQYREFICAVSSS